MVRPNPNLIPEAQSTALFGPGDTVPTNAKPKNANELVHDALRLNPVSHRRHPRPAGVRRSCTIVASWPRHGEWVRAWKPAVPGIHEVFHARFVDHAYPPHTHDTWTVFIVDEGAIRYDLETRHRGAAGARVTILPPHVVHDGRAASGAGFRKRVLYVGTDVLDERHDRPSRRRTRHRGPGARSAGSARSIASLQDPG